MNRFLRNFYFRYFLLPIVFFGCFYSSPYISLFLFKSAIEAKDYKKAEKHINFYSIRKSLKPQLSYLLKEKIRQKTSVESISPLEITLLSSVINLSVDSILEPLITIKGLKLLIEKGRLVDFNNKYGFKEAENKEDIQNQIKLYYKDFNTFILSNKIKEIREPILAVWKREDLFLWRLSLIELPSDFYREI